MQSLVVRRAVVRSLGVLLMVAWGVAPAVSQSPRSQGQSQGQASSGPPKIDPLYRDLANSTGGQAVAITPAEMANNPGLLKFLGGGGDAGVLVVADSIDSAGKSYAFPVDSTVRSMTVSVSGAVTAVLRRPDESPVQPGEPGVEMVSLSKMKGFAISSPMAGSWSLALAGSGEFSVAVRVLSDLDLMTFEFVELRGRPGHEGYFEISGFPLAGRESFARAAMDGPFRTARFELRSLQGRVLQTFNLPVSAEDREEFLGPLTPPREPFRVYVVGVDAAGQPYQRMQSALISPQAFRVRALGAKAELWPGEDAAYDFEVENVGTADRFTVTAVFGTEVVEQVTPASFRLGSNEKAEVRVKVQVPWDARPGSSATLIVTVQSAKTGGYNSAIVEALVRGR